MTCYFGKPDTIVIRLSFVPKIIKYRLHNMDSSFVGVSKYIVLHLGTYQMDVCIIFVCRTCVFFLVQYNAMPAHFRLLFTPSPVNSCSWPKRHFVGNYPPESIAAHQSDRSRAPTPQGKSLPQLSQKSAFSPSTLKPDK
jgi:hypothetical protein